MSLVARGFMHAATICRATAHPLLVNAIHAEQPLTNMRRSQNLQLNFSYSPDFWLLAPIQ